MEINTIFYILYSRDELADMILKLSLKIQLYMLINYSRYEHIKVNCVMVRICTFWLNW
jgi:hypothetical protein